MAARECESRPAARLRLLFREISAELSKLPRPLQKPPLPLLLFFCGRRRVSELIDLLACKVDGLRCGFRASPLHELRSCQPQLDKPTGWPRSGPVCRFASLPKRPHFHAIRTKAGLPSLGLAQWPACLSFFALRFCVTPSYFLYYPRRQQRLARKIGDGPAEWESTVSPGELPRPRRPRRSRRRGTSHLGGL